MGRPKGSKNSSTEEQVASETVTAGTSNDVDVEIKTVEDQTVAPGLKVGKKPKYGNPA